MDQPVGEGDAPQRGPALQIGCQPWEGSPREPELRLAMAQGVSVVPRLPASRVAMESLADEVEAAGFVDVSIVAEPPWVTGHAFKP